MRKDQKHLDQNLIHSFQIRFIVEALQGDRRDRGDQANEYVDTRDEDETSGWRFEQIANRIHQRYHGKAVKK